jgi:hypothetical protein
MSPGAGGIASGQWLDAQSWEQDSRLVMVGTEDGEMLAARLPECGFSEDAYPVHYLPDGFDVWTPRVDPGSEVTLHFVVADNPHPEPAVASSWVAADINHKWLLDKKKLHLLGADVAANAGPRLKQGFRQ